MAMYAVAFSSLVPQSGRLLRGGLAMSGTADSDRTEGFILAGGGSVRFGKDKALALYECRPLLDWSLEALHGVGAVPCIVTPQGADYRARPAAILSEEQEGLGPVEGVRVALERCRSRWAILLAVDMPRVDGRLLRALLSRAREADRAICLVDSAGRRHPFPGLYRPELAGLALLLRESGSMQRLLDQAPVRTLSAEDLPEIPDLDARLLNVNQPEDLAT
jgi:molybdopterin-guanine dinucleotide biosynthesis protein A